MIGRVVISKAGKDKGKWFLIIGIDFESERLLLCDGQKRKIENPKKKNLIHVQFTNYYLEDLRRKILKGEPISNFAIKEGLKRLAEKGEVCI